MSNFIESISLAIKLKMGIVPSTQAYEAKYKRDWEDVEFYCKYSSGDDFKELKEIRLASKEKQRQLKEKIRSIKLSSDYKRYKKIASSAKLMAMARLRPSFIDEFEGNKLNSERWLNKFFWGDKIFGKGYSHAEEFHHYTESENVQVEKGNLIIHTKGQKNTALSWDKKFGFIPRHCDYTSGIINTGNSFRQKQGRFEAKVLFEKTPGVYNAFWMVGDTIAPHINIFKINHKFQMGIINDPQKDDQISISSSLLNESSYIVGIEWDSKTIKWLLNGVVVKKITNNLPGSSLYLVFSSGVHKKLEGEVSNQFRVDWVKCYEIC